MSRVFIVRHGDTFAIDDVVRRIGARTDLPLVPSGVEQADAIGQWLASRDVEPSRVLTGPLHRATATAAVIAAHLPGAPHAITASWLNEIDHGPDEGKPEAEAVARIGNASVESWEQEAVPPPGWVVDAPQRLAAWAAFWRTRHDGDVLIVTSNGAARFALLAHPALAGHRPFKLRTGAFGEIHASDGNPRLIRWNVRPHG